MAGYHNFSMSNNAVAAYASGKLPASKAAAEFGFRSPLAVRMCVHSTEWHHTSSKFNCTDFFDVPEAIQEANWQELATWRPHLTRSGWHRIQATIREKLRAQWECAVDLPLNKHQKSRSTRLMELDAKFPTPYQRRNGLNAVVAAMQGKELSEANYLEEKAKVDARRAGKAAILTP